MQAVCARAFVILKKLQKKRENGEGIRFLVVNVISVY